MHSVSSSYYHHPVEHHKKEDRQDESDLLSQLPRSTRCLSDESPKDCAHERKNEGEYDMARIAYDAPNDYS